jgi:transcriptional regulator with XRE-family HTH domain
MAASINNAIRKPGEGREQFVARLTAALLAVGCDATPTRIAKEFNLRYPADAVTVQAARRWMQGETYPGDVKLIALAAWLEVDPAWLRFGDTSAHPAPLFSDHCSDGLERDLPLLSPEERQILRKMTDLILAVRAGRQ